MTVWLLTLSALQAQELRMDRPEVPSAGLATEGGPGTPWVNPANLAYDPDDRFGLYYARGLDPASGDTLSAAWGAGGVGFGVHTVGTQGERRRWAVDSTTAVELPERVSLGWRVAWNLVPEGRNYLSNDLAIAWRPLPWLGAAAVTRNIGAPDPEGVVRPESGVGLALRPLNDTLLLGVDYIRRFAPDGNVDRAVATGRLRIREGWYVRGHYALDGSWGAGTEFYLGGFGLGGHATQVGQDMLGTGWIGTDEPGASVVRPGNKVPNLHLYGQPPYQPASGLFATPEPTWLDTLELLRRLEGDRSAKGLVLTLGSSGLSWAHARELRDRVLALEASGRPVVVYLDGYPGDGDLWVASAASKVLLHPAGNLALQGQASEMMYFRGALDAVGVKPQFVKRSEYKSAPEQQTEVGPSDASLEQMNALLDDLHGEIVAGIAEGRGVEPDAVRQWIDDGPYTAAEALALGIVDELRYPDEVDAVLEALHGDEMNRSELYEEPQAHSAWEAPQQIALIYIDGVIVSGPSGGGGLLGGSNAGSATIVEQLQSAADDMKVRAVVIRVDSPGGSAFASDEIWRAVQRVRDEGKPVVVSMGSVAASGGYYVSAGADAIWAEPTTITGSIGVYSGKMAIGELLDRVGVTTTTLSRGRNATIDSSTTPWDARALERMEVLVDDTYVQFKQRVADGRGMTPEAVEEVARGRVWSGRRAQEVGLVDDLGGLQDAIADARERAGLPANREVALVTYTDDGALLGGLAPALVRAGVRVGVLTPPPERPALPAALEAWGTQLAHPETLVWMLDDRVLSVRP